MSVKRPKVGTLTFDSEGTEQGHIIVENYMYLANTPV
jgi:hypothetical protein